MMKLYLPQILTSDEKGLQKQENTTKCTYGITNTFKTLNIHRKTWNKYTQILTMVIDRQHDYMI